MNLEEIKKIALLLKTFRMVNIWPNDFEKMFIEYFGENDGHILFEEYRRISCKHDHAFYSVESDGVLKVQCCTCKKIAKWD